jgi:hypothetical protein
MPCYIGGAIYKQLATSFMAFLKKIVEEKIVAV